MNKLLTFLLLVALAAFATAVAAADQPIYKWTDANGTLHYSDKAPAIAAANLQTLDLPPLPPQDPAKIAADQAAQVASTAATLKLLQAQLALQQQQLALQLQQAQLDAALNPPPAPQTETTDVVPVVYPIYARSAYIPHAYRRNLYRNHRSSVDRGTPFMRPGATLHTGPARPVVGRPLRP